MQQPKETGAFLTDAQVEEVARTIYNRFMYEYGFQLQFNDNNNAPMRKVLIKTVKQTLDALDILGYEVKKVNKKEVGRKFLSKAALDNANL